MTVFGPQLGQTKVDKILSQFSLFYSNPSYIGELIMPPLKVKEKTGKVAKYGKENLRVYAGQTTRNPGDRAQSVDYSVSQGQYVCQEHALEKKVPDEFMNNQDDPYDAKRDAVKVVMDNLWQNQEYALANAMANTGILTNNVTLAGGDQWNNAATSKPLEDINIGIDAIRTTIARRPNSLSVSYTVFKALKIHPEIRDAVKYTNGGQLSDTDMGNFLKQFFNLKNVFVGEAVGDLAVEGQTSNITDLWGKHTWLHYTPDSPSIMQPSFGYTLFDVPRVVDTYRENAVIADFIRVRYSYDQNITDANAAYLIKNAIA